MTVKNIVGVTIDADPAKVRLIDLPEGKSVMHISEGFWIDAYYRYTTAFDDCWMWIPPSQIKYLMRNTDEQ